jgi:hypothetical protein
MNYKEKYEMALETIQEILDSGSDSIKMSRLRLRLQSVFPEIRESKDEKIRKEIIKFLELPHPQFVGKRHQEDWLAWLEKQGDKDKFIEKELGCIKGYRENAIKRLEELEKQGEQKPADNDKLEDEEIINSLIDFVTHPVSLLLPDKKREYISFLEGIKENGRRINFSKKIKSEKQVVLITETNGDANIDWDTRSLQDVKLLLECGLDYIKKLEKRGEQKPNPYSGTSFEYNGHTWGMCARDNGVDILLDKQLFKHLEKQDEQKQEINNFDVLPGLYKCVHRMFDGTPDGRLLFEVGNVYKCLSKHDRAEFEVSYGHSVYLEDPVVCKHFIPFEKQGVQKPNPCDECINVKGCINCENGELRETEQKSVDKAESKFKPGDWIVQNERKNVVKVVNATPLVYKVVDILGYHHTITNTAIENNYHLWTIEDAKPGDVLACENGWTCIFKCLNDNLFSSYCFIDNEGWFCGDEGQVHMLDTIICGEIYPATKEQRDLLFSKMNEAGYEWDAEKKELKKIEQNSFESDSVEKAMRKAGYEWSEETHQLKKIEQEQTIDYPENLPKDNWELVHEFVEKFGRIPKDEDELNALVEYILKRQKSAWSEEDEKMLNEIVGIITGYNAYTGTISVAYDKHIRQIDWLKLIKDRIQPQNCIYYNPYKEVVESIAEMCKHYDKASHSGLRDFYDNVNVKCKDAKEYDSLFPQNTWKPSDEQIQALDNARHSNSFDVRILDTLFHDLKKLREE